MKKAVLLAPYFLPRRRVGAWRPFKFAIHLKKFGWKPHIVTIKTEGSLTEKERKLLNDIRVYSISSPFDFTEKSDSSLKSSGRSNNKRDSFHSVLKWIDRQFPIDTWLPLFLYRKNRVKKIIDKINPDLLWSTGDPWSVHWLGYQIAKKYDLPWVADFRDPWTLGEVNLKERSVFSSKMDKYYERKVVENADLLTFTAKATENLYKSYYKSEKPATATIYNSFDSDLYNSEILSQNLFDSSTINLIFFGSFRTLSPAEPFIKILKKLHQVDKEAARKLRMYSFGGLNKEDKAKAERAEVTGQLKQLKPVPPENALSILSQADILWLSTHPHRKHIIPAKLWDYLAAGKPILSTGPNPEIARILEKTNTGRQFNEKENDQLAELLQKCVKAKQRGSTTPISFNPDKKQIAGYEASHSTRKLAQLFDSLV